MQIVCYAVQKVCYAVERVCYAVWTVWNSVHWSGWFAGGSAQEDYLPLSGPLFEPCQHRLGPTFEHFNDFLQNFQIFLALFWQIFLAFLQIFVAKDICARGLSFLLATSQTLSVISKISCKSSKPSTDFLQRFASVSATQSSWVLQLVCDLKSCFLVFVGRHKVATREQHVHVRPHGSCSQEQHVHRVHVQCTLYIHTGADVHHKSTTMSFHPIVSVGAAQNDRNEKKNNVWTDWGEVGSVVWSFIVCGRSRWKLHCM